MDLQFEIDAVVVTLIFTVTIFFMALNGLPGQKTFKGKLIGDFDFFPHGIHHGSPMCFSGSVRFCKEVVAIVCSFCRRNIYLE